MSSITVSTDLHHGEDNTQLQTKTVVQPEASTAKTINGVTANRSSTRAKSLQLLTRCGSLSDALRLFGAAAVAGAMALYLLDGVHVVNDVQRFFTMLGLTGILTAAGLAMSIGLQENRSSRVFIGLALLSIPVNTTILGALFYSWMPMDSLGGQYPEFAFWQVESPRNLLLASAIGFAVLVPVSWFGLSVLARGSRKWLTSGLLLSAATLMIPVRHELVAAALALATTAGLWWLYRCQLANSLALKTSEGRFAFALLFVAPIIIVVRSMFLYEVTGLLALVMSGGFFLAARQLLQTQVPDSFVAKLTVCFAVISAFIASASLYSVLAHYVSAPWAVLIGNVSVLMLMADLLRLTKHSSTTRYASIAGVSIVTVIIALHTIISSAMIAVASIAILLVVTIYGRQTQFRAISAITLVGSLAVAIANANVLWQAVAHTGWWGIAIGGAAAIIAASLLDRINTTTAVVELTTAHTPNNAMSQTGEK